MHPDLPWWHPGGCQMATKHVRTMAPFCAPAQWDEAGADRGIWGGLKAKHMEPEGAQGARSAPQATKGPTLTFMVEKEPPAGWRLVVTSGVSLPVSAPQAGPASSCLPCHRPGQPGTESTQQTGPRKDNFYFNTCTDREPGRKNHFFWIKGTTPFKRKVTDRTALWIRTGISSVFRIAATMWRTECENLFVTCCFVTFLFGLLICSSIDGTELQWDGNWNLVSCNIFQLRQTGQGVLPWRLLQNWIHAHHILFSGKGTGHN